MVDLPVETARKNLEVVPTTTTSFYEPGRARMVYGYAYRCTDCNEIWLHRKEAVAHPCAQTNLKEKAPIVVQRIM